MDTSGVKIGNQGGGGNLHSLGTHGQGSGCPSLNAAPKISIIIPVYNVEKYLAKCLDSVLAQTFGDFEVLCVDHSSTDGSLAILQEYAGKDERIKIIPCVNTRGGPGQARNAGLDHVRGKYTYFLDSDDWIDPTLCEKAYYRLEQSGADVVFFSFHCVVEKGSITASQRPVSDLSRLVVSLTAPDYMGCRVVPWNRVIAAGFLRKIDFRFLEGMTSEDLFLHWVLMVHEPKTELILEQLVFHLVRDGSQIGQSQEYVANSSQAYSITKQYLQKIGKYEQYREELLLQKYDTFLWFYPKLRKLYKPKSIEWLRETMDDDEVHFLTKEKRLDKDQLIKLHHLLGYVDVTWIARMLYVIRLINKRVIRGCIIKPIEMLLKREKSLKPRLWLYEQRIDELNTLLAARDKEIVALRESLAHSQPRPKID